MNSNTRTKISFFSPNLEGGGAERIIAILATYLSKEAYNVDLLLVKSTGPYLSEIPETVNIIDFNSDGVIKSLPKLIKYLRSEKPDILFTSQMHSSAVAIYAAKLASVKTKIYIRQPSMLQRPFESSTLISKIKYEIIRKSLKNADKVVVSSQVMLNEFIRETGTNISKVKVIHNPIPLELIRKKSLVPINHAWFSKDQPPVVLAVGRLVKVKDFSTLLKAFAIVRQTHSANLVILGEGVLRPDLEDLIKSLGIEDYVYMPGFISNPYPYMKHAKLFVLSSLREGFPNSMVEAMACGTAIVSTNCNGGSSEILEDGKWGQIVSVKNPFEMADAIIKTLEDTSPPDVTERVQDFSIDFIMKNFTDLFNT